MYSFDQPVKRIHKIVRTKLLQTRVWSNFRAVAWAEGHKKITPDKIYNEEVSGVLSGVITGQGVITPDRSCCPYHLVSRVRVDPFNLYGQHDNISTLLYIINKNK